MRSSLIALVASVTTVSAVFQGFNYGATKSDGSFMYKADYEAKFNNAKNLVGTSGFTSARLYTMIQGGSYTNEPTEAIPAAISSGTSLLLGLWASGGEGVMQAEITALKSAIAQYGEKFTSLVAGISVGSEDLYRISPTGIAALSGYGANPDEIVKYIGEVRSAIAGTSLSGASIGHVDTWTAWVNGSNSAVVNAVDWIGFDAYPYFQNSMENSIEQGKTLFDEALAATKAAVGGKPVWITETGWPVSGKKENKAIPSTENAEKYWKAVGCPLFGNVNTWWFTMQDADPTTPNPSFGLVSGTTLSTTPLYDLSCKAVAASSSATVAPSSSMAAPTSSAASAAPNSATTAPTSVASSIIGSGTTSASSPESETSVSVASSIISSVSTAATGGAVVSSGGALGPSQAGPTIVNPTATPSGGSASGSGSGSGSGSSSGSGSGSGNGTVVVTPTLSNSGPSSTSSSPPTVSDNAAAAFSGSFVGTIGAVLAAALVAL